MMNNMGMVGFFRLFALGVVGFFIPFSHFFGVV